MCRRAKTDEEDRGDVSVNVQDLGFCESAVSIRSYCISEHMVAKCLCGPVMSSISKWICSANLIGTTRPLRQSPEKQIIPLIRAHRCPGFNSLHSSCRAVPALSPPLSPRGPGCHTFPLNTSVMCSLRPLKPETSASALATMIHYLVTPLSPKGNTEAVCLARRLGCVLTLGFLSLLPCFHHRISQ